MIRGFLLFFATLLFASVMGFAFGVFVAPAVDATQFRATVDAGVLAISRPVLSVLEKFKVTPAKVPPAAAPAQGEAPTKEAGSGASVQPQSDAGSGRLPATGATPPERRAQDVAEPSNPAAEPQSGHPTPAINAEEPVGSISPAPPANREADKQPAVSGKNPSVEKSEAQPPANKPAAKLKPKPKPAHKHVAKLKRKPQPAHKHMAKLKRKPEPTHRPVAKLKRNPKPNLEPELAHKPVEQPAGDPPHADGGDGWPLWLR